MKRWTKQWMSLTAAAAVLAAGCAAGPQRAPQGTNQAGMTGTTAASTTGDQDACAVALGNVDESVAGENGTRREVTANGILIGNVALVGLPTADDMPLSPTGVSGVQPFGPVAPGTLPGPTNRSGVVTGPNAGTNAGFVGPAASPNPPGTGTATEQTGSTGIRGGGPTSRAGGVTTTGAADNVPGGTAAGTTTRTPAAGITGATGATPANNPGMAATSGTNPTAIDRIRSACTRVTAIRVVTDSGDRARLAQIAMAVRKGQPVTDYMDDLARINRGAQTMGAGAGSVLSTGETVPSPGAPAGTPAPATTPAPAGGPAPGPAGVGPRTGPGAPITPRTTR
jgi:hypothetical protein